MIFLLVICFTPSLIVTSLPCVLIVSYLDLSGSSSFLIKAPAALVESPFLWSQFALIIITGLGKIEDILERHLGILIWLPEYCNHASQRNQNFLLAERKGTSHRGSLSPTKGWTSFQTTFQGQTKDHITMGQWYGTPPFDWDCLDVHIPVFLYFNYTSVPQNNDVPGCLSLYSHFLNDIEVTFLFSVSIVIWLLYLAC